MTRAARIALEFLSVAALVAVICAASIIWS